MSANWQIWEERLRIRAQGIMAEHGDAAHDPAHLARVVVWGRELSRHEGANERVVVTACWLHDLIAVPKNSPLRPQASTLCAAAAETLLQGMDWPWPDEVEGVLDAIRSHSFSAGITPQSIEAKVVQDADRLEALGAIGLARCLMLGGQMGSSLAHPTDPFASTSRPLQDDIYSLDHLYAKLLNLQAGFQTESGRKEAQRRTTFLQTFLRQLRQDLEGPVAQQGQQQQ